MRCSLTRPEYTGEDNTRYPIPLRVLLAAAGSIAAVFADGRGLRPLLRSGRLLLDVVSGYHEVSLLPF